MPGDAAPSVSVQLLQALRDATGDQALQVENLIVLYQASDGNYGVLSSLCCPTHQAALIAAGLYKIDNQQPNWIEPYSSN